MEPTSVKLKSSKLWDIVQEIAKLQNKVVCYNLLDAGYELRDIEVNSGNQTGVETGAGVVLTEDSTTGRREPTTEGPDQPDQGSLG